MPARKIAERSPSEHRDLVFLSLRDEPIGNAALIENLDGAREQPPGALTGELLIGAPLDDDRVDARQRQFTRQHQPCRTAAGDDHRMLGNTHLVPP